MRLLYVQDKFGYGGINRTTSVKASWLANHGYDVHNLCILDSEGWAPDGMYDEKIQLHSIDKEKIDRWLSMPIIGYVIRFVCFRWKYFCTLIKINPDIIIVTQPILEPFLVVLLTCWKKRIMEFHGWYCHPKAKPIWWERMQFKYKYPFYHIVALTTGEAEKMRTLTGLPCDNIPNPNSSKVSAQSFCAVKRAIILARFTAQKGLAPFLPYWEKVQDKHPDWRLDIYGVGPQKNKMQSIIDTHGLHTVTIHPFATDAATEILNSSIYIQPSIFEGWGLSVVECMVGGVPCVSYDCPHGPSDIIRDGEDGFLVPYLDADAMVSKINYLIEHEDKRKEMGQRAHENIQRFNTEVVMQNWVELFSKLVRK